MKRKHTSSPSLLCWECSICLMGRTESILFSSLTAFSHLIGGHGLWAVLNCQSLRCVRLFGTLWTVARQAPLSLGILLAQILEWITMAFSRRSSQPRDRTQVSRSTGGFFTNCTTREAHEYQSGYTVPSPGELPSSRSKPGSPALPADSLPAELPGKPSWSPLVIFKCVVSSLSLWVLRFQFIFFLFASYLSSLCSGFISYGCHPFIRRS